MIEREKRTGEGFEQKRKGGWGGAVKSLLDGTNGGGRDEREQRNG